MPSFLVTDVCALINRWTGFALRETAPRRIHDFLECRATALGYSSTALYADELRTSSPESAEAQRLINLVTSSFTSFWADEPQLEALRGALSSMAKKTPDRALRVWCAGASTGEEAYTVAMIARELNVDVEVIGTDINTEFLARATLGRYELWNLRRLSEERRNLYFRPVENTTYEVVDSLLDHVKFERQSLLDLHPGFPEMFDIIMCRNVLGHFSVDARDHVIQNFAVALADDGYLLLGSSESLEDEWGLFRPSKHGRGFVFRHAQRDAGTTVPIVLPDDEDIPVLQSRPFSDASELLDFGEDDAVLHLLSTGLAHASDGDTAAALDAYEKAAIYDPFVIETYYLLGMEFARAGTFIRSIESFQKALFLDPSHWCSALRLAEYFDKHGENKRALTAYQQTISGIERRKVETKSLFDPRLIDPTLSTIQASSERTLMECNAALERLASE